MRDYISNNYKYRIQQFSKNLGFHMVGVLTRDQDV